MNSNASFDSKLESRLKRTELINDDQLKSIRELQKESPLSLAEALVQLEFLSSGELDMIVHSLADTRSVKLEDLQIDVEAVKHVPCRIAMKCRCIPIRRSGNTLVVAVSDANIESVREELKQVTDFEIVLLMAEHDAIEHALFIYYGEDSLNASSSRAVDFSKQVRSPWSLRPAWTNSIESFLEHAGVVRAKEVAKQVASGGADSFNSPIILIGTEGSGKSHLLSAIKNYCAGRDPLLRGVYCEGSQLKSLLRDYGVAGSVGALRYDLRDCALLLIDDFADAWGNEELENEITESLSILKANGAAIMVSTTEEQYLSGPSTSGLRELLKQGTEIPMTVPDSVAQNEILEMRRATNRAVKPDIS